MVKGKAGAESAQKRLEASQDSADRHEGWRYFIEKTDLEPGIDPSEANQQRQAELEERESKALGEENPPNFPSRNSQR